MIEPINPSVWRSASRKTALSVSAVRMASGEYQGWPPRFGPRFGAPPGDRPALNHTVRSPRWRRLASQAGRFVTRRFCFGIWWRHLALALNGIADTRVHNRGALLSQHTPLPTPGPCTNAAHVAGVLRSGRLFADR